MRLRRSVQRAARFVCACDDDSLCRAGPGRQGAFLIGYRAFCEYAASEGALLEINGIFAAIAVLAAFLDRVGCVNLGVQWDVRHPFRCFNEITGLTVNRLGKRIRHVHVKASVKKDDILQYHI